MIDLHGLYADGPSQAALSRFRELAEGSERPFLVVEPTGQPGPLGGAGWEIAALDEPLRDDAAYLTRLIETMVSEHCADPRRVYLAGYSNGGIFAAEYACANPGRVAAVAAVAGFSHLEGCAGAFPVIVVHGTGDPVVPYDANGESILLTDETPPELAVQLRRGIEPQVQAAAKAAGCKAPPERTALSHDVDRFSWRGCDHGNRFELYRITGGGHTWPGAPEQPDAELIGATTASIDATQLAWAFFLRHTGRPQGGHR